MKKIIIGILMTLLMFSLVLGSDEAMITEGESQKGSIDGSNAFKEDSFWDILDLQAMTVINDATCSLNPDESGIYDLTSSPLTQICYRNTMHRGVAYILYEYNSDGSWNEIDEVHIPKNEKKCISVGMGGEKYPYELYFCDDVVERQCSDSDGGRDYDDKGTVSYSYGDDTSSFTDKCLSDDLLLERYCDSDESVATRQKYCNCDNGECVEEETDDSSDDSSDDNSDSSDNNDEDSDSDSDDSSNPPTTITCHKCPVNGGNPITFEYEGDSCPTGAYPSEPYCPVDDDSGDTEDTEESFFDANKTKTLIGVGAGIFLMLFGLTMVWVTKK